MKDLIERQSAIDALAKAMPRLTTPDGCGQFDHEIQIADEAFVDCMQIINKVPSAPQDPCYDEWCTECKEYDQATNSCPRWNNVIKNTISDIEATCVRLDTFLSLDDYDITPESVEDEGGTVKWGIRIRRKEHV